jgi:hypothetical protein
MPELEFAVESAEALAFAAAPTIAFRLRIVQRGPQPVRSMSLSIQVRIAATQRAYAPAEQQRLVEVFGEPSHWDQTLRGLLWTVATLHVPAFRAECVVDLLVPCTYDFEVASAKYFDALVDGQVPLELLFSGSVFYTGEAGLQVEQIAWDKEARFRMPVHVWHDVMGLYFPNTAWVRLRKDTFDRLYTYRARRGLPTWEAALDRLLDRNEEQEPAWTR